MKKITLFELTNIFAEKEPVEYGFHEHSAPIDYKGLYISQSLNKIKKLPASVAAIIIRELAITIDEDGARLASLDYKYGGISANELVARIKMGVEDEVGTCKKIYCKEFNKKTHTFDAAEKKREIYLVSPRDECDTCDYFPVLVRKEGYSLFRDEYFPVFYNLTAEVAASKIPPELFFEKISETIKYCILDNPDFFIQNAHSDFFVENYDKENILKILDKCDDNYDESKAEQTVEQIVNWGKNGDVDFEHECFIEFLNNVEDTFFIDLDETETIFDF